MTGPFVDRSYRALLGVPSLGRILIGMTIARTAGTMVALAMVLFALDRYGSPAIAGVVAFAMMFPAIIAGPIAGALLDRYGRMRLVVLDYLVAGGALALIAALAMADRLPVWALLAITAVASLTEPLSATGLRSLFPLIVPEPLWERANAADSNASVIATLIAPPVAAVLVQVFGGPVALLSIAAVYLLAALAMLGIPEPPTAIASTGHLLRDARDGLVYVWRNSALRSLAFSISVSNLGFGVIEIAVPVIILDRIGAEPAAVGLVFAALAAGGMVSALAIGRLDTRGIERALIVWPLFGMAFAVGLLIPPAGIWLVFVSSVLVGLFIGPVDVGMMTLRQRRTDPAWLGRAFAVSMSLNGLGGPIGAAIGGWMIETSLDAAVLFGVGACVAAAVIAWATLERGPAAQQEPVGAVEDAAVPVEDRRAG